VSHAIWLTKCRQKRATFTTSNSHAPPQAATCPGDLSAGSQPGRRLSPTGLVSRTPAMPRVQVLSYFCNAVIPAAANDTLQC